MKSSYPLPRTLLLIALLLGSAGCVGGRAIMALKSSGPVQGQVLELNTNQPISGAIIVGRWQEALSGPGHGSTICSHVETATTDAEGRYQLPAWQSYAPTFIDTYKPGYARSPEFYKTQLQRPGVDLLEVFTGTREERLEGLRAFSGMQCGAAEDYGQKLTPLYKAIYEEAKYLAVTKEEKKQVIIRLRDLEEMEFGYDKSWDNWRNRIKELQ